MPRSTLTAEQANEHDAKAMLADALNKLRKHAWSAISDLEDAIETLRNVERSLESVPDELDADSIDLGVIAEAVRAANDEWAVLISVRWVGTDIDRAAREMLEAVGQVDYLLAGDFSDDA